MTPYDHPEEVEATDATDAAGLVSETSLVAPEKQEQMQWEGADDGIPRDKHVEAQSLPSDTVAAASQKRLTEWEKYADITTEESEIAEEITDTAVIAPSKTEKQAWEKSDEAVDVKVTPEEAAQVVIGTLSVTGQKTEMAWDTGVDIVLVKDETNATDLPDISVEIPSKKEETPWEFPQEAATEESVPETAGVLTSQPVSSSEKRGPVEWEQYEDVPTEDKHENVEEISSLAIEAPQTEENIPWGKLMMLLQLM